MSHSGTFTWLVQGSWGVYKNLNYIYRLEPVYSYQSIRCSTTRGIRWDLPVSPRSANGHRPICSYGTNNPAGLDQRRYHGELNLIIYCSSNSTTRCSNKIHRCFCVYQRSLKVIVLPCLIFGASLGMWTLSHSYTSCRGDTFAASGLFTLIWYQNPISPKSRVAQPIIGLFFPLGFAQHFITTSLIVYRIYTHHQTMSRAGLHSSQTSRGQPNLLIMLRIILESAMIWTVEMLIITALLYLKNPAQVIVKHASIPCSGKYDTDSAGWLTDAQLVRNDRNCVRPRRGTHALRATQRIRSGKLVPAPDRSQSPTSVMARSQNHTQGHWHGKVIGRSLI